MPQDKTKKDSVLGRLDGLFGFKKKAQAGDSEAKPAKTEAKKAESAKPEPESAEPESQKLSPSKPEAKAPEPAKTEAKKAESAKPEPESAGPESQKLSPSKPEAKAPEPAKTEAKKAESAKPEPESAGPESQKLSPSKPEAKAPEPAKTEAKKAESAKPKPESAGPESQKLSPSKPEAKAPEPAKTEAKKAESAKPEPKAEAEKPGKSAPPKSDKPKAQTSPSSAKAPQKTKTAASKKQNISKTPPWEDKSLFEKKAAAPLKLNSLFAFKLSMTAIYDESGVRVPVTALQYKPWTVSQIKTKEKEGYAALQLACHPQKNRRCGKPLIGHLAPAGFKHGARHIKEIRLKEDSELPKSAEIGQTVSIESLKKGDIVRLSGKTKGRGFAGVMKRWGFAGGKASHGSKSHRRTGSIGQHTEPARVMPGRKMPGRYGFRELSRISSVFDVLPEEGLILVKGPVPGARNTLISLQKRS